MRFLPEFVKLLKTNVFKLAWEFLPEFFMTLTGGLPKLVLIAEFTGSDADIKVNFWEHAAWRWVEAGKLVEMGGYGKAVIKTPKKALESKGYKQALRDLGLTEELCLHDFAVRCQVFCNPQSFV